MDRRQTSLWLGLAFVIAHSMAIQNSRAEPIHVLQTHPSAEVFHATVSDGHIEAGNQAVSGIWVVADGHLKPVSLRERLSGAEYPIDGEIFTLGFTTKKTIRASEMSAVSEPKVEPLPADPSASRLADRSPGSQVSVTLQSADGNLQAVWRVIGRDGGNYLRQEVSLRVLKTELPLGEVVLVDWPLRFPWVCGTVKGAPIISGNMFCGLEHPMATSEIIEGRAHCMLERAVPLSPGQELTVSSVVGAAKPGQLRRDFLAYLERERAHPYRPFLHYNTWYDLGYFTPFDDKAAVGAIETFGEELTRKRGVKLDSFLFDDGWDDHHSLWGFNKGFPNGFAPLKQAAEKYGAEPGVWLSPWGGYGKPHDERVAFGKESGIETNSDGFILSSPRYYDRFHEVCLNLMRQYGINQFKFDGTRDAAGHFPGSRFGSDFEAAIQLIQDLRAEKRDVYVNLTTGTWPSPFWLRYADSIWRGGEDDSYAGVGTWRQRWITYRDGDEYHGIVAQCPLYPLNSLMLHGIIYASHASRLNTDPANDFADEVRAYFGTGTQLQEMYITPALLSQNNWDTLAEAARWARENADTLVDTHWVGGDPAKGNVYGWASWSPRKGILTLRNPDDKPANISIDIATTFELPEGAPKSYTAHSPWSQDHGRTAIELSAGQPHTFELAPFKVLTLEAMPVK